MYSRSEQKKLYFLGLQQCVEQHDHLCDGIDQPADDHQDGVVRLRDKVQNPAHDEDEQADDREDDQEDRHVVCTR